jgi:hypothetical protein
MLFKNPTLHLRAHYSDMTEPERATRKSPFQPFVSADVIRKRLSEAPDGFYLGDKATASKSSRFHVRGGAEGNVLVVDDSAGGPTEMILQGAFRVDPRNFYMTADAGFDPDKNMFNTPFSKIKANCRLTPIIGEPDFAFSIADYDTVCENIRALQSKAPGNKNDDVLSVLHRLGGGGEKGGSNSQPFMSIKVSHSLFTVRHSLKQFQHIAHTIMQKKSDTDEVDEGLQSSLH